MLIKFAVSNFLSFSDRQELTMIAGKTRHHAERIHKNHRTRLIKNDTIFGANSSGKSNLIKAISFVRAVIIKGFPKGFSNSYCRLNPNNRTLPTEFEIEFMCNNKHLCYGFSVLLSSGSINEEWLFEITPSGLKKDLYSRNVINERFDVGPFFKSKKAIEKLNSYGEDSINDQENLFLTIINKSKGKMYSDYSELLILKDIFNWFAYKLSISMPEDMLKGSPYFKNSNLREIGEILNALGTGITNLRIVDIPQEVVKNKIPTDIYNDIVLELEKSNAQLKREGKNIKPSITARAYKEFYTFEIDDSDELLIKTIEFEHESNNVYFNLDEESDGTARLLNLIEILLQISDEKIYVIDEIDRCLHPLITSKLVGLFLKAAEKRNTQLIFTTHESRLLKENILRNDEISFMVRNDFGSTILNSLDKYQLRADKNVYEALFDGTINAVPKFNNQKLDDVINRICN